MSNYQIPPDLTAYIKGLEDRIQALEKANPLNNGTIDQGGLVVKSANGTRAQLSDGQIRIWSDFDDNPTNYGLIYCDPTSGLNYFRIFPPYSSGTGLENSITIKGRTVSDDGNIWLFCDGQIVNAATDTNYISAGTAVQIDSPRLELYNLPTVGSADYALGYDLSGGNWSVSLVTSSRKYKQDIETADLPIDAILNIRPVTFRDISAVEKEGDEAKTNFGVIAEELEDLGLGEYLVTYKDGEPDAAKYDRIALVLIPVIKKQQGTINDLIARVEALEAKNA